MSMLVLLAAAATTVADGEAAGTSASDTPSSIAAPASAPRPAIMFNRWQEDWSILAKPEVAREPLDQLKYIPLGDDPKTYLSFGANLRERFETNDAPSFGTNPANPRDSYVISRMEVHADLHAGPVQAFVQLQSDFAPGKQVHSAVDTNSLDLEQAFVAVTEKVGPGTVKFRVGRQQFAFDLQRFVAARDGPNVRQSFDALWGDYENGTWRLIGYYSRPVTNRDNHPFDDGSGSRNLFYGVRVERLVLGGKELSAYWSRFTNDNATWLFARGAEQRDVWDIRFAGKQGRWDWDLEGMGQTGHMTTTTGAKQIRAWAFGSRSGYTFTGAALTPRLGLQVDGASGNRANSSVLGTFNPLFPNGYYVSLSGYTGYVNFLHVKPSLTVRPTKAITVMGAVGLQWRMTTADAIYTQPTVPVARTAGTGERWTGAYEQMRIDWKMSGHWTSAVEGVHFDAGSTIRDAAGHDSNYLGVELKYGW